MWKRGDDRLLQPHARPTEVEQHVAGDSISSEKTGAPGEYGARSLPLLRAARQVHQQLRRAGEPLLAQQLDQSVAVGERRHLRGGDHEHVIRRQAELRYLSRKSRSGVDQDDVGLAVEVAEAAQQAFAPVIVELGQLGSARGRRHQRHVLRAVEADVFERFLAVQHVLQVVTRMKSEQQVQAGLRQIRVDQQHARPALAQRHGEIRGEIALAHAALAARHHDGARVRPMPARRMVGSGASVGLLAGR
jgi:hypothetical protein